MVPAQSGKRFFEFLKEQGDTYSVAMDIEVINAWKTAVDVAKAAGEAVPDKPGIFKDGRIHICTSTVSSTPKTGCSVTFCDTITNALHFVCEHPMCRKCYSEVMTAASDRPDEEWGFVTGRQCPVCRAARKQPPPPARPAHPDEADDDIILLVST